MSGVGRVIRKLTAKRRSARTSEMPEAEIDRLVAGQIDDLGKAPWEVRERLYYRLRESLKHDHDSTLYAARVYRRFFSEYRRLSGCAETPKSVLEFGPGRNLAIGLLAVASGVERYAGVDLNLKLRGRPHWFYAQLVDEIESNPSLIVGDGPAREGGAARARSFLGEPLASGEAQVGAGRIDYRSPCDAAALPFENGSFEYAFSNAVFEHFYDPAGAIREIARVLAPGGISLHKIDFRYHRDKSKPLTHLAFTIAEWEERKRRHGWTNRWRRPDYRRAAREAGLEVIEDGITGTVAVSAGLRATLQPEFRELPDEELSALGILIAFRRLL